MSDLIFPLAIVRDKYASGGLPTTDNRKFNSHLTVAKLSNASRGDRRALGGRGIPSDSFTALKDEHFGEQIVEGLELLSMNEPEDEDGYYYCFEKLPFK